jgi:hypothetical protein
MKTLKVVAVVMLLGVAVTTTYAQGDPAIRILPAIERNMLKVLYVHDNTHSVQVRFYNDDGLNSTEVIDKETFQHGFLKKYDIHRVRGKSFWIEVSDNTQTVTYKMMPADDKKTFVPYLERAVYNPPHPLVASNN